MAKHDKDHTGDIGGVVIEGNTGSIHLGNGDVHDGSTTASTSSTSRTFSGDGMTVIKGDNHGTISRNFS